MLFNKNRDKKGAGGAAVAEKDPILKLSDAIINQAIADQATGIVIELHPPRLSPIVFFTREEATLEVMRVPTPLATPLGEVFKHWATQPLSSRTGEKQGEYTYEIVLGTEQGFYPIHVLLHYDQPRPKTHFQVGARAIQERAQAEGFSEPTSHVLEYSHLIPEDNPMGVPEHIVALLRILQPPPETQTRYFARDHGSKTIVAQVECSESGYVATKVHVIDKKE